MTFYTYIYRYNDTPIYVGKGKKNRSSIAKHRQQKELWAFVKDNQDLVQIEVIAAIDEAHAFFMEECLIEMFGRLDKENGTLFNKTKGGGWPNDLSDESKAKISEKNKGRKLSAEHKLAIGQHWLGNTNRKGAKHSSDSKAKMAIAHTGKKHSLETLAKMAASHKARNAALKDSK